MNQCEHILLRGDQGFNAAQGGSQGWHRCGRPGTRVAVEAPAGRGVVAACYCELHGGEERARREVESDWNVVAPPEVVDVLTAGTASLTSVDVYAVIRRLPDASGGGYVTALGVGTFTRNLPGRYTTREEAEAAVREAWRRQVEADVAEIKRLRGGTLDWGYPVEPRSEPILLYCDPGVSAWDCVVK